MDVLEYAERAIERLECDDWEIGPFDGHCLRLTCKRCIFDRVAKELAAATAEAEALRGQLASLRRGCMVPAGTACRLCLGSWLSDEPERVEDHHDWCPMRATVGFAEQQQRGDAAPQEG